MSKPEISKVAKCNLRETESVRQQILVVRGHRVMLDGDLAKLYGVTTKRPNQQFGRNRHRFPQDFAFCLTLGSRIERQVSECHFALSVGEGHSPVILGEPGDEALLGVVTLENLGLVFNPFSRTLHPMKILLA